MTILDFQGIVRSEREARGYLLSRCKRVSAPRCPSCSEARLYTIEGGARRRCAHCGYTFNPFSGRYLNRVKLSAREWLWAVKLFGLEMPATVIATELGISYPTGLKAIDTIREAIAAAMEDGDGAADETNTEPACSPKGLTQDTEAPIPSGAVLMRLCTNGSCLVLTEKSIEYSAISCRERIVPVVDLGKGFPHLRVYCNAPGFWPYAKERLSKYHGVSPGKLALYLREMEFRWEHRNAALFEGALDALCAFVPSDGPDVRRRGAPRGTRH